MNAFVSENSIVIGQERLTDKENEISAIPRLLERLDITNAVVSIDAIGTQVEIADQIIKGHGNYFLAVKDNQPALSEAVKDAFKYNRPISEASQMEADHGRIETRDCRILDADCIEDESVSMRWPGLRTLVEITSSVERQDGQKS